MINYKNNNTIISFFVKKSEFLVKYFVLILFREFGFKNMYKMYNINLFLEKKCKKFVFNGKNSIAFFWLHAILIKH
ncbi:hypothetical protein BPP43_10265 [Brachyspira pilosicoli P43/6/78]|uniref:Uncharacterized protein n=1 Tax=Brachyspira pilosicoli P43/6/78 TaxID=1042417 RepID=A0A3B6W3R4_BRAPL|nr:hypothetical protein BPP43_10265 [Brachyspira pilosicoli P43/6/78]